MKKVGDLLLDATSPRPEQSITCRAPAVMFPAVVFPPPPPLLYLFDTIRAASFACSQRPSAEGSAAPYWLDC